MKPHLTGILLFLSILMRSQQNFFNVPSSDIIEKKNFFFQEQLNGYNTGLISNSTITFGLGNQFEVGINVFGITYVPTHFINSGQSNPIFPICGLNYQKKFNLTHKYALSFGGQTLFDRQTRNASYLYMNNVFLLKNTRLIGGIYWANNNYVGSDIRNSTSVYLFKDLGLQLGIEQRIWKDRIYFQTDFISGKHTLGELVIGGYYRLNPAWYLSVGYQIPNINSKSVKAVVVELTYLPKSNNSNNSSHPKQSPPLAHRHKHPFHLLHNSKQKQGKLS